MAKNDSALLVRSAQQEYVQLTTNVSLRNLSQFTFEAWVKVGSATNPEQRAFMIRQGGDQKRVRFAFAPYAGRLRFELARHDGRGDVNYTYPYKWDDRWHHCAFAADGNESKYYMYLDGALVLEGYLEDFGLDAEDKPLPITDKAATAAYIGASSLDGTNFVYWDGKIDCIRIWSGIRSVAQIQAGMRTFIEYPDNETNLLGEWRLESTGTSSITATRPSGMDDGVWQGTLRKGPNRAATTAMWTSDRPFLGEFEQDLIPPTVPSSITASNITATSFRIAWPESTDNVYVQSYEVTVATTNTFAQPVSGWTARDVGRTTAVVVNGLDPSANYYARVRAIDANGNASAFRTTTTAIQTLVTGDLVPPTRPILKAATNIAATTFRLSWETNDATVTGFKVDVALDPDFATFIGSYRNRDVGDLRSILVDQNVPPATTLYARVRSYDASENESQSSETVRLTTLSLPDTEPPTEVVTSEAAGVESRRFVARWLPATDNVGVAGYRIDVSQAADFSYFVEDWENRDVGNVLQVVVEPVSPQSTYYYRVRAYDVAGNVSPNSEHVESVSTMTVSLAEEGLHMASVVPTDSATIRLNGTSIATSDVNVELRAARPVGRAITPPPFESFARYMFSDREGPAARNNGTDTHQPVNLPYAEYVGPIEYRVAGPQKTGFGQDAKGVRFLDEEGEVGHVVLPPTLPNLTAEDGTANDIYFWFKVDDLSDGGTFLEYARDETGQDGFRIGYTASGQITLFQRDGMTITHSATGGSFSAGTWNSLLYSRSKSGSTFSVNLFLNGTKLSASTSSAPLPHKYRPLRWVGRGTDGTRLKGAIFGLMFGTVASTTYTAYATMEDTLPTSTYLAAYRFPLTDVTGRIESINVSFPVFEGSGKTIELYHLTDDDWGETHFSRAVLNTRGTPLVLTPSTESEGIEADITSLIGEDTNKDITLVVAQQTSNEVDGLVLGRHDDTLIFQPTLALEVDYSAAVEPRTLTLSTHPVELVNYVSNPSFEAGTAGISVFGGAAATVTSDDAFIGDRSVRIDPNTSATNSHGITVTTASGINLHGERAIQASFYVKGAVTDTLNAYMSIIFTDGTQSATAWNPVPVTTEWTRYDLPERLSNPDKTVARCTLYIFKDVANTAPNPVWIDAVMVTDVTDLNNRVRIPYFDGSFATAESRGVVHASPSYFRSTEIRARGTYVGDNNQNATALLQYRPSETTEWVSLPDTLTMNRETREVTGSIPVLEGVVNHIQNPSGELGTTEGWTIADGVSFDAVTDDAVHGLYSFRLANAQDGITQTAPLPHVEDDERWTFSMWAKGEVGDEPLNVSLIGVDSNGNETERTDTVFVTSTNWERYDLTHHVGESATKRLYVRMWAASDHTVFLDGMQLEQGATRTPYIDGDQVGGWWESSPHLSRSGRFVAPLTDVDVRVLYDDPDGVSSSEDVAETVSTPAGADNTLTVVDMKIDTKPREMYITLTYKGDDNETGRLRLEWKRSDRTNWSSTAYAWNRKTRTITARVERLEQGTSYDVLAVFDDDSSEVYGENPIMRTAVTPIASVGPLQDAYISYGGFVLMGPYTTNISVTEHNAFNAPERELSYHKLARVHGEVEQEGVWRKKVINMSGYISAKTREELADTLAAFQHAMTGYQQRLVIDTLDSRGFYTLATVTDLRIPQVGGENYRHLRWEAEFTCSDPFRYDTSETIEEDIPLANGEVIMSTNKGDVECDVFYTIVTENTVTPVEITLMNKTTGVRITPTVTVLRGDTLEVDTARLRVLKNGVEVDFLGGFPRLNRGANELSLLFSPTSGTEGISLGRLSIRRRHRFF